jgi:hypothetical protein
MASSSANDQSALPSIETQDNDADGDMAQDSRPSTSAGQKKPVDVEFIKAAAELIADMPTSPTTMADVRRLHNQATQYRNVAHEELPLPLDDPRRTHDSIVPGLKLNGPSGTLDGGRRTMSTAEKKAIATQIATDARAKTKSEARAAILRAIDAKKEEARAKVASLKETDERREAIRKQIQALEREHEMELRVAEQVRNRRRGGA